MLSPFSLAVNMALFLGLLLVQLTFAVPHGTNLLQARDPCDGVNSLPVLYHTYQSDVCPPAHQMYSFTPICMAAYKYTNDEPCAAFCQQHTFYHFAQEAPFANSWCRGPMSCTIDESWSTSVSTSLKYAVKMGKIFKFGISGGWSWGNSTGLGRSWHVTLADNECGYFTFLPIEKVTCGTYSETEVRDHFPLPSTCNSPVVKTEPNICATQWKTMPGREDFADGNVVFVRVDCTNLNPLRPQQQDVAFRNIGVPLDRGVRSAMIQGWDNPNIPVVPA